MNPAWHGERVLVTGATGMVGSWLCRELLARGAEVIALVRDPDPQSELYRSGDVARTRVVAGALEDYPSAERALNELEPVVVFHLGAQTLVGAARRSPLQTFRSNIEGSWNLLEACRRVGGVRGLIVASSDKAYGAQAELPYREDMPLKAAHPYDVSKSCTDLIARTYAESFGLPIGIARCGNIYGGGDLNWSRIVPGTIRSLLHGARPVVRSDGHYVRDYLYVRDAVSAYLCLAEAVAERSALHGEAFNFGNETPVTVLEIVDVIRRQMKSELEPDVLDEATGEIREQWLSSARASRELGWNASWELERGLDETIDWYRGRLGAA